MSTAPERAHDYHQDTEGRLSSSIARPLVMRTPAHAKAVLDGDVVVAESDAMKFGTVVHQQLLRDDRVVVSPYDEYRSNEAKAWKAAQEAAGLVPIKAKMWDAALECSQHVNGQILAHRDKPIPFTNGSAEVVLRWEENGAKCRAMLDWLHDDHTVIDDLKTTVDGSPHKFRKHIFNLGYDIQAAFYVRAVEAVHGVTPRYRWVVVETKPPYPLSMFELSDRAMASARAKVDLAISLWKECLASGEWPAYGDTVHEVELPGWVEDMAADPWAEVDLEEVPF